jgi:hypothetical protein
MSRPKNNAERKPKRARDGHGESLKTIGYTSVEAIRSDDLLFTKGDAQQADATRAPQGRMTGAERNG